MSLTDHELAYICALTAFSNKRRSQYATEFATFMTLKLYSIC